MRDFLSGCLTFILILIIGGSILFGILAIGISLFGPNYKQGNYTMVYKVYYSNNPRIYTINNDWPISLESYKGTNSIKKTTHNSIFRKLYGAETIIETSAPIEVVSYTYKEK